MRALPNGVANVGEVVPPARAGKDDKIPARPIVRPHSSG